MELSKKQRGAFNEARAVAWMIGHGMEVFVQFGEGVIDLVGYVPSEGRMVRCEVKTAQPHVTKSGDLRWYWRTRKDQMLHVDMLLVVADDGRVFDATGVKSPVRQDELVEWDESDGVEHGVRMPVKERRTHSPSSKPVVKRQVRDKDGNKL